MSALGQKQTLFLEEFHSDEWPGVFIFLFLFPVRFRGPVSILFNQWLEFHDDRAECVILWTKRGYVQFRGIGLGAFPLTGHLRFRSIPVLSD